MNAVLVEPTGETSVGIFSWINKCLGKIVY